MSEPTETEILNRVLSVPPRFKRRIVALAGPPASGKSTLAERLAEILPAASVVPMDGFHLDNRILSERNLRARKGAPDTFDVAGFYHLLDRLRNEEEVFYPLFDRKRDCAVAGAGRIDKTTQTIVAEGNYLLLDTNEWRRLHSFWDVSLYLDVPETTLRTRLMQRWLDHGFSQQDAETKVDTNDMPNAKMTAQKRINPDMILKEDLL
ncbi:MAG: nucleoside/nucleotide kinase family protein [Roseobacter sp.]